MGLTKKQEIFCQEVVKQDTYSAAYRIAYDASAMSDEAIGVEASRLLKNPKITLRVNNLKSKLEKKALYTIGESVARDKKLIERYEAALDVLEDDKSEVKQTEAAERTIRYIGSTGYNSAQERLSKQHGFFKKDNDQSKPQTTNIINLGSGQSPNEAND